MDEYIDKNAAVGILEAMSRSADCECIKKRLEKAAKRVSAIPAADVAPVVHGRWEWFDEETGTPITGYEREWGWRCSHCEEELPDDYDDPDRSPMLRFCPNCGATMDGCKEEGNA